MSATTSRRLPVRPNLDQLKHQAKDLLRAVRSGDPAAIAELNQVVLILNFLGEPSVSSVSQW